MTDEGERGESPRVPVAERWALLVDIGAMGQAAITGGYAWAMSVLPIASPHGAPPVAKLAALLAIATLAAGVVLERISPSPPGGARVRPIIFWVFVLSCGIAWLVVPEGLVAPQMSPARAIAALMGWALFAHACAAPAIAKAPDARIEPGLSGRAPPSRFGAFAIVLSAIVALGLQTIGWSVAAPERAVLLRLVTLASGVALVTATATVVSSARRASPVPAKLPRLWLALLGALAVVGVAFWLLR